MKPEASYAYRASEISSADALQLVITLHDMLIEDLRRCIAAVHATDVQKRTNAAAHAFDVLEQLQCSVDLKAGGEAAKNMDRLYAIARLQLLRAQMQMSAEPFERQMAMFIALRDAWREAQAHQGRKLVETAMDNGDGEASGKAEAKTGWMV